mmetsp:Transcript_11077/g.17406  ORF Transcript_11077/g.17406 Transcript_11077/m.17406 type:complete len:103 (-) Transcript_11077:1064-1372(-)
MFELLSYTPSGGSWTRNLLPDSWKGGSGGNSQYWGPGTGGDPYDPPTQSIPLARLGNPWAPGKHGNYMQTYNWYAKGYTRGPGGIHTNHSNALPCPKEGGIC